MFLVFINSNDCQSRYINGEEILYSALLLVHTEMIGSEGVDQFPITAALTNVVYI